MCPAPVGVGKPDAGTRARCEVKILIVSDLHANLEALRALPGGYDQLWVLGDLLNYGPNPAEVIDYVRENAALVVRGNHDDAIGYGRDPKCSAPFRRLAEETACFTMSIVGEQRREFLRSLPLTAERVIDRVRFFACHATPASPLHDYREADSGLWDSNAGAGFCDVMLAGHTHIPFSRMAGGCQLANPGSVGQSKRAGARACYAVWEEEKLRLESVRYPVEHTLAKVGGLPVSAEVRRQLGNVLCTGLLACADQSLENAERVNWELRRE